MFDGIEVRGIGRQKHQATTSLFYQLGRCWRLMKAGVVQHNDTARRQSRQKNFFKISVDHLRVATSLKDHWRDQFALLGSGDNAGALPSLAGNFLINALASKSASMFTIEAVIHTAFVQIKDETVGQLFQFAPKQPPLHLVAFAVFCEFFLK